MVSVSRAAVTWLVVCACATLAHAAAPGDSCTGDGKLSDSSAADYCDAGSPKYQPLGCCWGTSKCFNNSDAEMCKSFVGNCPFQNATKAGASAPLACMPDATPYQKVKCPGQFAKLSADWSPATLKLFPSNTTVTCFESEKISCQVFNSGEIKHFDVKCKGVDAPAPATSGSASLTAATVQALLAAYAVALLVL